MTTTKPFESSSAGVPERLSAWMDGELPADEADDLVSQWREDAQMRADWHAFHLIGDVLRSEDLASPAQHDAAFLAAVRGRLAQEPVVLAPNPQPGPAEGRLRPRALAWSSAAAMAVLVVGATMWNTRDANAPATPAALSLAQSVPATQTATAAAVERQAQEPQPVVPPQVLTVRGDQEAALLRDAEIDRYLAAHQQFVGTSALGMPSGFIRNAAVDGPRR